MLSLALELLEDRQNNSWSCPHGGKDFMYLYAGNTNTEKQLLTEWIILLEDTYISQLVLNPLICMTVTNTWTMRTRKESPQIRFSATLSFWHKINMNWKRLRSRDTTYRNIDYKTEWLDVVIFQNEKNKKRTNRGKNQLQ